MATICRRKPRLAPLVMATAIVASSVATTRAQQPSMLQQFGDWGVYAGTTNGQKVCFALAQPGSAETNPPNRPRDPVYFYVSTRPSENVRNEVSVIIGYGFRPRSEASAEIGTTKFNMQTSNDNAWLKSPAEESRLVDAMRKGADLVVKGVSGRGTQTTDRYSLRGFSQALDRVAQECR